MVVPSLQICEAVVVKKRAEYTMSVLVWPISIIYIYHVDKRNEETCIKGTTPHVYPSLFN